MQLKPEESGAISTPTVEQIMPENNDIASKPLKRTVNLLIAYMSPQKFFCLREFYRLCLLSSVSRHRLHRFALGFCYLGLAS